MSDSVEIDSQSNNNAEIYKKIKSMIQKFLVVALLFSVSGCALFVGKKTESTIEDLDREAIEAGVIQPEETEIVEIAQQRPVYNPSETILTDL